VNRKPVKRPNIIFIVADDLGYADLGCYGAKSNASPTLDQLALNGLRFTQGYSNSPVCSPTRFALMTGRYQYRLRGAAEEPINFKSRGNTILGLPVDIPTLPSMLRKTGYQTALFGKWHLGFPPQFGPLLSGYDEFFGPMAGGVDYFTHCDSQGIHDLWLNDEESAEEGYLTDLLSNKTIEYIQKKSVAAREGTPFFISLHYTAPHWPWETRDDAHLASEVKNNLFHLQGGNVKTYQQMIHHMDEGIGEIVATLKAENLLNDTLIIFTSDNGGERFSDNWPLVGGKMDLTEGGIRVPWIVHWPALIPQNQVSSQISITMDWTATILDIAGASIDPDFPLDGISMLPILKSTTYRFERPLYWRMNYRAQRAYRLDEWKYLQVDENEYLFNIAADERERANLAEYFPARLTEMRESWLDWNLTMPAIPQGANISVGYSIQNMPQR
jgi:arylsulfatase A-like enzyme